MTNDQMMICRRVVEAIIDADDGIPIHDTLEPAAAALASAAFGAGWPLQEVIESLSAAYHFLEAAKRSEQSGPAGKD